MSLSHPDCHRPFAERPAKLPELQGPVLATRKLRPRPAVIATLRTDDLPVLGHGLNPSVWKNGVLINREAPDHRVVRHSLAHALSLSRRAHARTSQDAEQRQEARLVPAAGLRKTDPGPPPPTYEVAPNAPRTAVASAINRSCHVPLWIEPYASTATYINS